MRDPNTGWKVAAWSAALGLTAGLTGPAWAAPNLVLNGKVASTAVKTINGQSYVSLADLAKALDMVVVKNSDGSFEIKRAGGATQVQGLEGKLGDVLFDGKWRFTVTSVSEPESYAVSTGAEPGAGYYAGNLAGWNTTTRTVTPAAGHRLVVLQCRVINAVPQQRRLWIGAGETNTALADAAGESHPAVVHDFEGAPTQSKPLLQGAKLDFNLVFSIPKAAQLKDLVFTLVANGDLENRRSVRVSLTAQPGAPPPGASPAPAAAGDGAAGQGKR